MSDIVITGLGVVSPLGNNVPTFWESLCAGKSGLAPITRFDASPFRNNLAGEVKNFTADARDDGLPLAYQYAAQAIRSASATWARCQAA